MSIHRQRGHPASALGDAVMHPVDTANQLANDVANLATAVKEKAANYLDTHSVNEIAEDLLRVGATTLVEAGVGKVANAATTVASKSLGLADEAAAVAGALRKAEKAVDAVDPVADVGRAESKLMAGVRKVDDAVATNWKQHEANVTRALRQGVGDVGEQVTMDVSHPSLSKPVRIRADNTVRLADGSYDLVDAKFSSVKDLTMADLEPTLTKNQKQVYKWLADPAERAKLTVTPVGQRAIEAGIPKGASIRIANPVQVYVNTPTGYAIRPYL